jgi:hypothetical protein
MTPDRFVSALRQVVSQAAVTDTLSLLESPPGRKPAPELIDASHWYRSLSDHDRANVARVLGMVSHQVLFGILAVLDGVRSLEGPGEKGDFRLVFRKREREWELVGPGTPPLHDIL